MAAAGYTCLSPVQMQTAPEVLLEEGMINWRRKETHFQMLHLYTSVERSLCQLHGLANGVVCVQDHFYAFLLNS